MRYLLLLLIAFPAVSSAQNKLHLSFHTGIINNSMDIVSSTTIAYNSNSVGPAVGLRLWKEYKGHWQIGAELTTGLIQDYVEYYTEVYRQDTLAETFPFNGSVANIFSPAILPGVFGNYRQDIGRNNYLYGGVSLGAAMGNNNMAGDRFSIAPTVGGNIGISLGISEHARFNVQHWYRFSMLRFNGERQYLSPPDGQGNYSFYEAPDINLHYVVNTISIQVDF